MRELPRGVPQPPPEPKPAGKADKGWWPDPNDPLLVRYYDGTHWTDRTAPSVLADQGPRLHFRHHLRHRITWGWIWSATVFGLLYLMVALPFADAPALGWLAMVALCAVLVGPFLVVVLPASWQEFRESGGHEATGLILCAVMIEALLIRLVVVLPLHGLVFRWLNRITVFVGLAFLVAFVIAGFRIRIPRPDGSYRRFWLGRVLAVLLLTLFVVAWRVRILDAFWLR